MIKDNGGTPQTQITNATDILITGYGCGRRKINEATKRGIEIIDWMVIKDEL